MNNQNNTSTSQKEGTVVLEHYSDSLHNILKLASQSLEKQQSNKNTTETMKSEKATK